MKDGFVLNPGFAGVFYFKNVFAIRRFELIFAVLKNKGFQRPFANEALAKLARSSKG